MTKEQQKMIERLRNMGLGYRRNHETDSCREKSPDGSQVAQRHTQWRNYGRTFLSNSKYYSYYGQLTLSVVNWTQRKFGELRR